MTDHAQLDVGYRFLDLAPSPACRACRGRPHTQKILVNELRAGVRYMID